jgi:hypothetical protein
MWRRRRAEAGGEVKRIGEGLAGPGSDGLAGLVRANGGVLTAREALAAGVSRAALEWARRKQSVQPLRRGVFTSQEVWEAASPIGRHKLLVLAQQRVHPGLVASGTSAAVVLDLPTPSGPPQRPVMTAVRTDPAAGGRGHRAGVLARCSQLAPEEIWILDNGIRVTSTIRTVLDCAREWDLPWGLAIADAALGRWPVLPAHLLAAAVRRAGISGGKQMMWVAEHTLQGIESPLESLGRGVILLADLPEPTPQVWVSTRRGPFRVDLLDEANMLITEADGRLKYTSEQAIWDEKQREDALREKAEVMRFTMSDYVDRPPWIAAYRHALGRSQRRFAA